MSRPFWWAMCWGGSEYDGPQTLPLPEMYGQNLLFENRRDGVIKVAIKV